MNVGVITLKLLAIVALLKPILVRHASKAVTVFEQAFPGLPGTPDHPRSYTYFSGFHVLDFSDIKWGLLVGVTVYLVALAIQFAVASRPSPARISEGHEAS
jgi:hypothetical protein